MLQEFLGRFLDLTIGDGISSELSTSGELEKFADFYKRTDFSNFLELTPKNVNTRKLDEIILDSNLNDRMDSYYSDRIDMFPYEKSVKAPGGDRAGVTTSIADNNQPTSVADATSSESIGLGIVKPARFYTIQAGMIERRFPGGRDRDIGDGDVRDQISSMRFIFAWNYWKLIIARRGWTLLGVTVLDFVALTCIWLSRNDFFSSIFSNFDISVSPAFLQIVIAVAVLFLLNAVFVIAYFFLFQRHSTLTDRYKSAVSKSAAVLRTSVDSRLRGIVDAMPNIFNRGEAAKQRLKDDQSLNLWPQEGRKWPVLGVWMAKRVEHIELFMQIEMWRIRRIHYGLRVLARWLSCLMFVLSLLMLSLLLAAGQWSGFVAFDLEFAAFTAVLFAFSIVIGAIWIAKPRWISRITWWAFAGILGLVYILALLFAQFSGLVDFRNDFAAVLVILSTIGGLISLSALSFDAAIPDLNLIESTLLSAQLRGHHDTKVHTEMADLVYRLMGAVLHAEETRRG